MSNLDKHLISREDSAIISAEYDKVNYSEINRKRPIDQPDSKEFTFDLQVLKEYIEVIEKEMDQLGIKNKGLKITMGKYPEKFSNPNFDPKYLGYQTVFLSAAILSENFVTERGVIDGSFSADNNALSQLPNLNFAHLQPPY